MEENKVEYLDVDSIVDSMIEVKGDEMLTIAMEECAELIQAVSKLRRGKPNKENLAEEIADVLICIEIIKKLGDISSERIDEWIDFKLDRAEQRIAKGEFK